MFSSTLKSALVQQHLVSLGHDRLCWRVSDRRFTCFGKATQCPTNNSKNKTVKFWFHDENCSQNAPEKIKVHVGPSHQIPTS